jgi:hypothetical protein
MDLGIEQDARQQEAGPTKRRAVGSRDDGELKKITAVLAKLCLSSALKARCLQSILLTVLLVPESNSFVKVGLEATKKWTDKVKDASRDEKDKLGLPHVHCFNAMLALCQQRLKDKNAQEELKTIGDYCAAAQRAASPAKEIARDVRFWRIQRNYDREFKRIEYSVNVGTQAHAVAIIIHKELLTNEGVRELPGIAPAGDLERKVQAWLDANDRKADE